MSARILLILFLCSGIVPAQAEETTPVFDPPSFVSRREPLPDLILKTKKENRYFTLLPAIRYDAEKGFNFGALAEIFDNKTRQDPFFRITPYRQKFQVVGIMTTKKWMQALVFYDQPYLFDTPWRFKAFAEYRRDPIQQYFGQGDDSLAPLRHPATGETFGSLGGFESALASESNGVAFTRYAEYLKQRLFFSPTAEYDLLGGILRPLVGFQVSYYWIDDYTGDRVGARDSAGNNVDATQGTTRLAEDCAAGTAIGCGGGWDNLFKLGLTFDTRDFELDPERGFLLQTSGELATVGLGSDFTYQRLSFSAAGYQDLLPGRSRLVLAGRVFYSMQFGDLPFFSISTLAYTDRSWTGLGGFRSLRGFATDRFIGPAAALTNWELRWLFYERTVWKQNFRFQLAPFWDAGRVFDGVEDTTFAGWKHAGGAGLRVSWNLATVILFDYGFSEEGSTLYMELGYSF